MVKFVDPDSAEAKEKAQAKLQDFLRRHSFENVHGTRTRSSESSLIRFEEATPMQVAEQAGNEEVIELLVQAGAKRSQRSWFRRQSSMASISTAESSSSQAFKCFGRFSSKGSAESGSSRSSQSGEEESAPRSPKSCLKASTFAAEEEDDGKLFSAWV